MVFLSEPGFWQSIVRDMIVHPGRQSWGWGEIIAIAAILIGVAALHELPVMLIRWLFRLVTRSKSDATRNKTPNP